MDHQISPSVNFTEATKTNILYLELNLEFSIHKPTPLSSVKFNSFLFSSPAPDLLIGPSNDPVSCYFMYTYICILLYMCVYRYMFIHLCVYIHILCTCRCLFFSICVYTDMYAYVYIYTYILYTHTQTHFIHYYYFI